MSGRSLPALVALVFAVIVAIGMFVPFVAISYRRRGRLTAGRSAVWFALLVYVLSIWAYTLVPLRVPSDVQCVDAQLRPFQFVADVASHDG